MSRRLWKKALSNIAIHGSILLLVKIKTSLWIAPTEQLDGYTQAESADGYGIYLVFWVGLDEHALPGRRDGAALPTSASNLEDMLVADLSPADRERIRVVVFDVSKEAAGAS